MNKLKFFLTLFVTMLVQSTIFSVTPIAGAKINLVLVMVAVLSMLYGDKLGSYTGLALGLLQDIMFSQVLGIRALSYFLIGTFIGRALYNNDNHYPTGFVITFIMTIVHWLIYGLFLIFMGKAGILIPYFKGPVFVEAVVNAALFIPIMALVRKILKPDAIQKYSGF